MPRSLVLAVVALVLLGVGAGCTTAIRPSPNEPSADSTPLLPSSRPGPRLDAILAFIDRTTDPANPDLVPEAERLAVFGHDGTLWCEQPAQVQLAFAIERVRDLAPDHPEWEDRVPLRAAIKGDVAGVAATGDRGVLELISVSRADLDSEAFADAVKAWTRTAMHPSLGRRQVECVYLPTLELMELLRRRGFTVAICSGGGADFMRVLTEDLYGVPPELVIGSRLGLEYVADRLRPRIEPRQEIEFINDKSDKPVGIFERLARRPILAVGDSDGDFEMLEWTTSGDGPRLGVLLHHTDSEREFADDRRSPVGRLARGLDESSERGWIVVDIAEDWATVFP